MYVYGRDTSRLCKVVVDEIVILSLSFILLVGFFCAGCFNQYLLVIVTSLMTGYCLLCIANGIEVVPHCFRWLSNIGIASFSVYIWHQLIIAFVRYSIFDTFGWVEFSLLVAIIVIISYLSYLVFEKRLGNYLKKFGQFRVCLVNCLCGILLVGVGLGLYLRAGVVRNVPELDVYMNNIQRGMHGAYCDRVYKYDKEFSNSSDKVKVFVIGNSFGRDFANVILESAYSDKVDLSYLYPCSQKDFERCKDRFAKADRVFYVMGPGYKDVPEVVKGYCSSEKLFVVGNKNFGKNNGLIYAKRFREDYFASTIVPPSRLVACNEEYKTVYGDKYIDIMSFVMDNDGFVKVFTDDNRYISQDCTHLTRAGAQFYSRKIRLEKYFGI